MDSINKTTIYNTPLSIGVYSVEKTPTIRNEEGVLEIIFCLKGSVCFTYAYEEFTLHAGEYISVDKDAYYLYDGQDNLCVSFYIDLKRYRKKYPFITNNLFVCEGLDDKTMGYQAEAHRRLKGTLIAALKYLTGDKTDERKVEAITANIVDIFINNFDILFYHTEVSYVSDDALDRSHMIYDYIYNHMKEKISIRDLAELLNLSEGYVSEYFRKVSLGFREILSYIRANESEKYLLETDHTIIEISEECGFSDVKYYYSAFKKWYKCTPRQFRMKYGGNAGGKVCYMPVRGIREYIDNILIDNYLEIFI